jgi:putative NADH-flavin reductase
MNILIFGASGVTGHQLVKQAILKGHTVTAFVRNPGRLALSHPQLKIICGNILNYQLVEDAVKEKDAVLSALGAASAFKYDPDVVEGVGNIIKAMEANGIRRFIYMSTICAVNGSAQAGFFIKYIAPKILSTEIAGHRVREKMIRQSELRWTIIRPAVLTNGEQRGNYRSGENLHGKGFMVSISRADVANCMLRQLTDETFLKKAPAVMY